MDSSYRCLLPRGAAVSARGDVVHGVNLRREKRDILLKDGAGQQNTSINFAYRSSKNGSLGPIFSF